MKNYFLLAVSGILISGGLTTSCRIADDIIFQPGSFQRVPSADMRMLEVDDGVEIALLPAIKPGAEYLILYSHGNSETLFDLGYRFKNYNDHGFSVLGYDYRGYGASGGVPSEKNCYSDIEKVYDYAVNELKYPPEKIIIYGRSLGGGPATELALRRPAAALVLESAFTSAYEVILSFSPPGDQFDNLSKMPELKIPLLIVHGENDELIPISHGEKNFSAAAGDKYFLRVKNAGHNQLIFRGGEKYWKTLKEFVDFAARRGREKKSGDSGVPGENQPE